jgi:hypothetical protein
MPRGGIVMRMLLCRFLFAIGKGLLTLHQLRESRAENGGYRCGGSDRHHDNYGNLEHNATHFQKGMAIAAGAATFPLAGFVGAFR